ncbi:hypothetical protein [Pedobacter sp. WC2423]|uniref:hypothetical protein n=1 Tax=Pedobacter sp. WC2423 TaxID=3234142 RepID=UPI00346576BD
MKLIITTLAIKTSLIFIAVFISCNNVKENKLVQTQKYVYDYYKNDKLKLRAAKFLLDNMNGNFHIENGHAIADISTMEPKTIIRNIDSTFKASQYLLNNKSISFDDFLEFVLPYRINFSKDDDWKNLISKNTKNHIENKKLNNSKDIIEYINNTNKLILPDFKFDVANTHEDTLSYTDIFRQKKGSCITMAYMGQYYYRALGIPVSFDYVLCWGNMAGAHTWNSLILQDHKLRPFLGLEQQVTKYDPLLYYSGGKKYPSLSTYKKAGKIYRHTYSLQRNSLAYKYKRTKILPPLLQNYRSIDVTRQYHKVINLNTRKLFNNIKSKILLACNYSSQEWIPISAAEFKNNGYRFDELSTDMLYLLSTYDKSSYKDVYYPFYIDSNGKILTLKPTKRKGNLIIKYIKSIESDQAIAKNAYVWEVAVAVAKNQLRTKPLIGQEYTLFLWQSGWKQISTISNLSNKELVFKNVPENGLYLISSKEHSDDDRPFFISNGAIKWL